jgi:hypothetical protein
MRLALLLTLASQAIFAQTPACDGNIVIVRLSEIKPGHMSDFTAATAAHKAWYRNNGIKDNEIINSRVIVRDQASGAQSYSDSQILSYHINPPSNSKIPNRGDAAWNAYVKQYRDSSEIKNEYVTCMPKHSMQ